MELIKLSSVAKSGVKGAKKVKPVNSKRYNSLVKEADAKIEAEKNASVNVYRRAAYYVAR